MAYKIGFWNYRKLAQQNENTVGEWDDLGLNYAMTPFYLEEEKEQFFSMLRDCESRGIELVVKDYRTQWTKLAKVGEKAYREGVREAYKTFKDFKCVHSFFIGDEPSEEEMDTAAKACRIVKEECGGIKAFLSVMTPVVMERNELKEQLVKLIKDGQLEYIVYNCYSQGEANEEQRQQGINSYFEFLNMFREIRKETGVPVWISLLGMGHWTFRKPTQDDVRWQLNTAAMYGIEGFIWYAVYYYYSKIWHGGPRGFAINHMGDRTENFQWMREENWFFRKFIAPTLEDAELIQVYQQWRFWLPMGGTKQFVKDADEIVSDVIDYFNRPIIISRFRKKDGKHIVAVCNGSQTDVACLQVSFKAPYEEFGKKVYLAPGGVYLFDFEK